MVIRDNITGIKKSKCTPGREDKQDTLELLLVVPTQHIFFISTSPL